MSAKRELSSTGFYHVVVKAVDGESLFKDDADRRFYLKLLRMSKDLYGIGLHVWAFMDNHAHLLIEDRDVNISSAMGWVNANYARAFNKSHKRRGPLFWGRFWSEPIERESQLLAVMNYIHDNPQVAGICPADRYVWSSFGAYAGDPDGFTDTSLLLGILGGVEGFKAAWARRRMRARPFEESKIRRHLTERELAYVVEGFFGHDARTYLRTLKSTARADAVRDLLGLGLSVPEISRFVGLSAARVRVIAS